LELKEKSRPIACVTGASGLIGRRIVKLLLGREYAVRALSRRNDFAGGEIEVFGAGLESESVLADFLRGAQMLFHCAAEVRDQAKMREVNVRGTERLLRVAADAGIEYLCHFSSAAVTGKTREARVDESTPCHPRDLYEETKLAGENLAAEIARGCRVVILRPTEVVDHQRPGALALPRRGSPADRLKVFIQGGERTHVIHAADVAAAALFFVSYPLATPQCFLVSCDHEPLNTFAGLWALYSACRDNRPIDGIKPAPHLPPIFPHLLRRLWRGGGYRNDVRYSPRRLLSTGFSFPLGLVGAVRQVIRDQGGAAT
jgi:nucleoside-diphosphate-sugar epimerase